MVLNDDEETCEHIYGKYDFDKQLNTGCMKGPQQHDTMHQLFYV